MRLTLTTLSDEIFTLEVGSDMELENFKALVEYETSIPSAQMVLVWNGRPLHDDKRKLEEYGIKDGDVLLLQRMQGSQPQRAPANPSTGGMPTIDFGSIQIPAGGDPIPSASAAGGAQGGGSMPDDPATIRQMLLNSPHDLAILKERNPPLAEALLSGSLEKFTEVLRKQQQERADKERDRIRLLAADPFDPDAQTRIAEEIRLKNVESNMETAMEFAPESFGQVVMLYVDCKVNGQPVKAFVDSGAQMTIMSRACAERCNIMRLVDVRWAGIAKGVGTQKIIGRVHLCQIQIGPDFLQTSFSILEEQPMDMLLGLDMLKRHQCIIDMKRGVLTIGTTSTVTPFLAEGDLPEHARLNINASTSEMMDEDRQLAEALNKSAQEASPVKSPGTSAGSSASKPAGGSSSTQDKSPFPEEDIAKMLKFGFSRQQCIEELTKSNGNVDQAIASLFAKSFQVP